MMYINLTASELQELVLQLMDACDRDGDYRPILRFMEIYTQEVHEMLDKIAKGREEE